MQPTTPAAPAAAETQLLAAPTHGVSPATQPGRLLSLDVFRGLTVAAMILVNNPGNWGHI